METVKVMIIIRTLETEMIANQDNIEKITANNRVNGPKNNKSEYNKW